MKYEEDPFEKGSSNPHYSIIYNNLKIILTSSPFLFGDNLTKVKINNQDVIIETRLKRKPSQIPAFLVINPYIHKYSRILNSEHKIYIKEKAIINAISRFNDNFND